MPRIRKMSVCPPLAPHVELTLEALAADGITPTPAEVHWLAKLREPCDSVLQDGQLPPVWGAPAEIAGELFWPLHPVALQWFRRAYALMDGEEGDWCVWVYMYAHTHSAPGDKSLLALASRESIMDAVGAWRSGLAIQEELERAVVRFLRQMDGLDDDVPEPIQPTSKMPVTPATGIESLCKLFPGTTPEYWQTGISERDTAALLDASHSGEWATCPTRKRHIENYLRAVKWIRLNHAK